MYYLNSRYYNPEIGRFINADGQIGQPGDILGHNMYAYAMNNPVMMVDPSGFSPEAWHWIASGVMVVGGITLIAKGAGGVLGGALLAAGINSMVSGYINEANGGSFTAGWVGGTVTGAIMGSTAGASGMLFNMATKATNFAALGLVAASLSTSIGGGFNAGGIGSITTDIWDGRKVDWNNALINAGTCAVFNGLSGFTSTLSYTAYNSGARLSYKFLGTMIGVSGEIIIDALSYSVNKLNEYFDNNKNEKGYAY